MMGVYSSAGVVVVPCWADAQLTPILIGIIVLAAVGTTVLFILALLAYTQRRTTKYLLITIAIGLLVVRSLVGLGTVFEVVPMTVHHIVEHSFDFLIAVLVLYAVYRTGAESTTV